ncbi:alanyl-tRNA editing protein [Caldanaerobacter subterraneus]|uniref:alanyl-tRNA editing protein n=1 Tax=Caldanaerobacter subterraneus TaxID=911092 RepID=UPI0032C03DC9
MNKIAHPVQSYSYSERVKRMDKLFYEDSYVKEFEAVILKREEKDGEKTVVLDRTYFYPEGGGQPSDTGKIGSKSVIKVYEKKGEVYHVVEDFPEGERVHCVIDWDRRFDHMQQHTGQHLLSSVLLKKYGADTESFSIGENSSHITVTKEFFTEEEIHEVEKEVNGLIYKNLAVKSYFADEKLIFKLPLRKKPQVKENIRIVEIEGIDYSPCGGTHVKNTGEIGILKIKKWERTNKGARLEFVCGFRALEDYQKKNSLVNFLTQVLSEKEEGIAEHLQKLLEDYKEAKREVNFLKEKILKEEAENLVKKSELYGGIHIVYSLYEGRDPEDLKMLGKFVTAESKSVAILGNKRRDVADIVVARSYDVDIVVNGFFKEVLRTFDGKGGGSAQFCQGGGSPSRLELAMDKALKFVIEEINKM